MSTEAQHPTTSHQLADKLLTLLQDHGGFRLVEVLHPTPGLTSLGAHSALVIVTADGTRFGLECTPFPTLRHEAVREYMGHQYQQLPEAEREKMNQAERETYGCTHPDTQPCFGKAPTTVRGVDGDPEGA